MDRTVSGAEGDSPAWRCAFVGPASQPEFRELLDWLGEHTRLWRFDSLEAAAQVLENEPFDGVVLGQTRRGEFTGEAIETLHRAAPLARLAIVYGTWCEGESRSGKPPAGVVRWHWLQAAPRLAAELDRLSRGEGWAQPRAASDLDRLQAGSPRVENSRRGLLAIAAGDKIAYETSAEPCLAVGYECLWLRGDSSLAPPGAAAMLADFEPAEPRCGPSPRDSERIERLLTRSAGAPLILLIGYPRIDDVEIAQQHGVTSIVAKPFLAEDLLYRLPG